MNGRMTNAFTAFTLSAVLAFSPGTAFASGNASGTPVIHDDARMAAETEPGKKEDLSAGPATPNNEPDNDELVEEQIKAHDHANQDDTADAATPGDNKTEIVTKNDSTPDKEPVGTSTEKPRPASDAVAEESLAAENATSATATTADAALDAMSEETSANEPSAQSDPRPVLHAQAHVQDLGWMTEKSSGTNRILVGTTGRSLRVEALRLWLDGSWGQLEGRAHVQNDGWQPWSVLSNAKEIGTTGRGLRVEALRLRLPAALREAGYSLYYRLHVQDFGWLGWAKDGELAGSAGYAKRAEAIELCLVAKGETAPSDGGAPYRDAGFSSSAHVQNIGWQNAQTGYSFTVGTTGRGLRVEALTISRPSDDRSGDVIYEAHVANVGWQGERKNGQAAGTSGRALRLEALRIRLTGDLENSYDVWYRVHVQDLGWMGWTKNGEKAGTQGAAKRMEAVQVAFVAKGDPAPSASGQTTETPFIDISSAKLLYNSTSAEGTQDYVTNGATSGSTGASRPLTCVSARLEGIGGSVRYATHVSNLGWTTETADGAPCGNGRIEALRIRLTGSAASCLDVYYRVHVSQIGWLDWTCNGQDAGSTGLALPIEAYEVRLVPKGTSAPGPTAMPRTRKVTGDATLDAILNNIIRNVTGTGPDALRKGYNYMMGFPFRKQNDFPRGTAPTWLVPYATEMYTVGSGNCYRSASLMCAIARALGYNANVIAGGLRTRSGIESHGWTEVRLGGRVLILDPNLARNWPDHNFYLVTYADSPAEYHR